MTDIVGLFETEAQLDALLAWSAGTGRVATLVAMTAQADLIATRRGVAYRSVEDLYDEEFMIAEGNGSIARLEAFCRWLDDRICDALGGGDVVELFSSFQYIYHLSTLHGSLFRQTYMIVNLLKTLTPSKIVHFAVTRDAEIDPLDRYPTPSIAMTLAPLLAERMGIEALPLPGEFPPRPRPATPWTPPPRERWDAALHKVRELRRSGGTGRIVVVGPFWSDREVLEGITRRQLPALNLDTALAGCPPRPAEPDPAMTALGRRVLESEALRGLFRYEGLDFLPAAADLIVHFLEKVVPRHLQIARLAAERFAVLGPASLLVSWPVTIESLAAVAGARAAGATTFVMQHGGFTGYHTQPIVRYGDAQNGDYYLCYGSGTAAYAATLDPPPSSATGWPRRSVAVATGSPMLQAIRAKPRTPFVGAVPGRGVRVLIVQTLLRSDWMYFSWAEYPPILHARIQRDLIRHLGARSDVELTIRPYMHDAQNLLPRWISDAGIRCRIHRGDFDDAIEDADLIVLEMGSTTLLKALARRAQIVQFSDERYLRLRPEARALLEPRVWLAHTPEQLPAMVDAAVESCKAGRPRSLDDRFLESYGGSLSHDASERIIRALVDPSGLEHSQGTTPVP